MATHGIDRERSPSAVQPYLNWAIDTGFAFLRPGNWVPLLVEFTPDTTLSSFLQEIKGLEQQVRVPALFRPPLLPPDFKFCVVLIPSDPHIARDLTNSESWSKSILRLEMGPPVTLPAVDETPQPVEDAGNEPCADASAQERVVVAVLDQGIAFAHDRFRFIDTGAAGTPQRSRVAFVWVQDASGTIGASTPGTEVTALQIDTAVQQADLDGTGEEYIYRNLKALDMKLSGYKPLAHRESHGTHVLDLASGYDIQAAPRTRPIIAVDMPEAAVGDPAGSTLTPHALWGLVYILDRAQRLRRPDETLSIVANLSYGPHEGPHDGSSVFERCADALIEWSAQRSTPLVLVLAAGNFRQSRTHAHFRLTPARPLRVLEWRLQPGGLTPSFMELYFPSGSAVQVTLTPPRGPSIHIDTTLALPKTPVGTKGLYTMEYASVGLTLSSIMLSVAPTAEDYEASTSHPVVPCGVWKVEVLAHAETDFDAWIKRSDTPAGRRAKGRQSYFDDPAYRRYDGHGRPIEFDGVDGMGKAMPGGNGGSYVQRRNTLSGIATGRLSHVIGAYRRGLDANDLLPLFRSSEAAGFQTPGRGMLPINWLGPSREGACPGVLAAGTRSGIRVAMSGTSVAAPQATRYLADILAGVAGPATFDMPLTRVPVGDTWRVDGIGLMRQRPPIGRLWPSRRTDWQKEPPA